ncbi:glycosyltransferase family 2 protein [Rhizohabitans arisaemae]|uniref:glycosyltransferase family 2 protein n=1 Tax=Rhizohabitans arisaemae TaxID=2720610 RepID=UPI0024B1FD89|nr:glycosyltransferase [Rhizohabitans arisaemae]
MAAPSVSVIVAVYNVEDFLGECLDSVLGQSIGRGNLELIAVNDGSTDGSAAILDDYATKNPEVTVIHQPNSGGPGAPRNVALDRARGDYVFFLDSDDYLGSEALERMVAMAERNGSDVVLGKMVGTGGRQVPESMFRQSRDKADLYRHNVYNTLSPTKLYRRALIERLGLRFPEGLRTGEDQPFTALVYFNAEAISVVADYDCYYATRRPGHVSLTQAGSDHLERLPQVAEMMELVAKHVEPGENRNRLLLRHIRQEIVSRFQARWLAMEEPDKERVFQESRRLLDRWHNEWIQDQLAPWDALRAHCVANGLRKELEDIAHCSAEEAESSAIVDDKQVFANYPHFRKSAIPDEMYELTKRIKTRCSLEHAKVDGSVVVLRGTAYLTVIGAYDTTVDIVVQSRDKQKKRRVSAVMEPTPDLTEGSYAYPAAAFTARIADWPLGTWDLFAVVGSQGLERRVRLATPEDEPENGRGTIRLFTTGHGNLSVRVTPKVSFLRKVVRKLRKMLSRR